MNGFAARRLDDHRAATSVYLCLGPTIVGFCPVTGLINPFWGSLSGFPMYAVGRTHPVYGPHPRYEPVAFLIWPLVIIAARVLLSGRLLAWRSRWRAALVLAWAVSAFTVWPVATAPNVFPGWPTWCACE